MKFSERIGKTPIRSEIQLESMDRDLKFSLWNVLVLYIFNPSLKEYSVGKSVFYDLFFDMWIYFLKNAFDEMPYSTELFLERIKREYFGRKWDGIYDLIEYIIQHYEDKYKDSLIENINWVLEDEIAGYRIVGDQITKITDENELNSIEESSSKDKFNGVHTHLETALKMLSDRKSPDYRNSIKESISAVESICISISGNLKASLGDALKLLETKIQLHGALKQGFSSLYGYSSDADGIRHAMLDETNVDFEDAKYMLISCSAFINYLIVKAQKNGITLE